MQRLILMTTLLAAASALPLTAANAGTVTFSGHQSNVNAPAALGGRCDDLTVTIGNVAPFFSTGTSNFGSFQTTQSHCLASGPPLAPGASPVPYDLGQFTYLFADGDTLFGTYAGTLTNGGAPGFVQNQQDFIIDGGTGEFADATGGFSGSGSVTFAPGIPPLAQLTFSGAITAPGVVPEPGAWAMLVMGFGGVGALLRSRRRWRLAFAGAA